MFFGAIVGIMAANGDKSCKMLIPGNGRRKITTGEIQKQGIWQATLAMAGEIARQVIKIFIFGRPTFSQKFDR